jgi:hypothetical protein
VRALLVRLLWPAASLFSLLEDLSEVCTPQHCLDMIGWLEQHRPLLNSDQFIAGPMAVNAVCGSLFWQRI